MAYPDLSRLLLSTDEIVQSFGQQVRSGTCRPAGTDQRGCDAECGKAKDCAIDILPVVCVVVE